MNIFNKDFKVRENSLIRRSGHIEFLRVNYSDKIKDIHIRVYFATEDAQIHDMSFPATSKSCYDKHYTNKTCIKFLLLHSHCKTLFYNTKYRNAYAGMEPLRTLVTNSYTELYKRQMTLLRKISDTNYNVGTFGVSREEYEGTLKDDE
jgi:hypothetical protein